jgi:hypothetical protein
MVCLTAELQLPHVLTAAVVTETGRLHVPCLLWSRGQHAERETALARGPGQ